MDRILGEYREMPGLALTIDQAQRLWGCDAATARRVIDVLVARGVLQWSRDGRVISR
jgi:Fic family protein